MDVHVDFTHPDQREQRIFVVFQVYITNVTLNHPVIR